MTHSRMDRVVIMARGLGSRMGSTKGLLRLSPDGPAFVRLIADLYLESGFGVDVVTRHATRQAHRDELPDSHAVRVVPETDGGDTARTLLAAWKSWRDEGVECTHVWAHPVDLPLVAVASLNLLREQSQIHSRRVIRPVRQGIPGHPVVLPVQVLEVLDQQEKWQEGPLRDFLFPAFDEGLVCSPVIVELPDPGIVRDFDRPQDMESKRLADEGRGNR